MIGELNLKDETLSLAQRLFGEKSDKCLAFTNRVTDIINRARDKDFLLVHNPGGWGNTHYEFIQAWEKGIVEGVRTTLEQQGYSCLLTQHFRGGNIWWQHIWDIKEEAGFFFTGKTSWIKEMVAEMEFIIRHLSTTKVILIGVSQGAAFGNAVMQQLGKPRQVYSIEIGTFFTGMRRRVLTKRTLAIDSNGQGPDPMVHLNLKIGVKSYIIAIVKWIRYRLQGEQVRLSHCIKVPGHEYHWNHPSIHQPVMEFLKMNFGNKDELGRGS